MLVLARRSLARVPSTRLARHLGGRARAPLLDVERLEHGQRRRARRVEHPQVAEDGAERPSVGGVERDAAVVGRLRKRQPERVAEPEGGVDALRVREREREERRPGLGAPRA